MAQHFTVEQNRFFSLTPYGVKDSLLSPSVWDYSVATTTFAQLCAAESSDEKLILSSTAFDTLSLGEVSQLLEVHPQARVQISLAAELQRRQTEVIQFLSKGMGLDVLTDRPLTPGLVRQLEDQSRVGSVRICILATKSLSLGDTIKSLSDSLRGATFLVFLPSQTSHSPFHNPDHVIRILRETDVRLPILVFKNILDLLPASSEKEFYLDFDCDRYLTPSPSHQNHRRMRQLMAWLTRHRWVYALESLRVLILFLAHPSREKGRQLVRTVSRPLVVFLRYKIPHHARRAAIFVRHRFMPVAHSAKGQTSVFVRYKVPHVLQILWMFLRHRAYPVTRSALYSAYVFLRFKVAQPGTIHLRYKIVQPVLHTLRFRVWPMIVFVANRARKISLDLVRGLFHFAQNLWRTKLSPLFNRKSGEE